MERQDKDLMVSADAVTEAEKEGKKKLRKEKWKNFWQKGFMLIVIIILIILLLAKCDSGGFRTPVVDEPEIGTEQTDKNGRPVFSTDLDENAQEGTDIGKSKEEIQKELNEKVAANYINISMNSSVTFENGEAMGNLGIVNEEINNYPQVIQMYLIDENGKEGELIYQSAMLPVGSSIPTAKLKVNLPKGTYSAMAHFNAVNGDDGSYVGKACAPIKITILN